MQISTRRGPAGQAVLTVAGALDLEVAGRLREQAQAVLTDKSVPALAIDLAGVSFMDSTGLGALIAIRNTTGATDRPLILTNPSEAVVRLLELTKLNGVFTVADIDY